MDFTREPIIETIITPKEGSKLVVRSSKGLAQEEYFVDSVQVVSFGKAVFYRSLERPKPFLCPVADYEVLEVREARMVLRNVGVERERSSIKIGGGREGRRGDRERAEQEQPIEKAATTPQAAASEEPRVAAAQQPADGKVDKKRDRRRQGRRRRGREERTSEGAQPTEGVDAVAGEESRQAPVPVLTSILPPPSQLISETLQQYRGNELFKGLFATPPSAEPPPAEEPQE